MKFRSHRLRKGVTKVLILFILLILLVVGATLLYYGLFYGASVSLSSFSVEGVEIFHQTNRSITKGLVYVASTNEEQAQGFQNVKSFGNCNGRSRNESTQCLGMMFVTASSQNLCFWMKDTPLPLQQDWISSNGTVVYIYQAQPESLNTVCKTATDVLETSPSMAISLGDQIALEALS
jgi:uncharacterized membrane protein (UPF0127 family)